MKKAVIIVVSLLFLMTFAYLGFRFYSGYTACNKHLKAHCTKEAIKYSLFMREKPQDSKSLSLKLFNTENKFVKFHEKQENRSKDEVPEWIKKKTGELAGKGQKHKGDEGKFGSKRSKKKTGLYGLKGPLKHKGDPPPGTIGTGTLGVRLLKEDPRKAQVVVGKVTVRESMNKEAVRGVIHRHINEVKYCYQKELRSKPELSGRLGIVFTSSATGKVVKAVVYKTDLNNRDVETCITNAVRRWLFAKTERGDVVTVPFVLKSVYR